MKFFCIFQTPQAGTRTGSAGDQSAAARPLNPTMRGVRGRDSGYLKAGCLVSHGVDRSFVPLAQVIRLRMREERGGEGNREGKHRWKSVRGSVHDETGYRPASVRPGTTRQ
ncbi:hypothetical protein WMY93_016888 [Mugilogobius chulae]|uniref:MHC class I antigen n=1 Tax=Mugilogobius chulae TaxID=88201 RepID=A0AAW0NTP4_9GOBI